VTCRVTSLRQRPQTEATSRDQVQRRKRAKRQNRERLATLRESRRPMPKEAKGLPASSHLPLVAGSRDDYHPFADFHHSAGGKHREVENAAFSADRFERSTLTTAQRLPSCSTAFRSRSARTRRSMEPVECGVSSGEGLRSQSHTPQSPPQVTVRLGQRFEHLHDAVIADHDVGRLEIAMHDAGLVRDFESLGNLRSNGDGVGYRQTCSASPAKESGRTFSATSRLSFVSRARNTWPIPPRPRAAVTS
jgi:hypothetical protein